MDTGSYDEFAEGYFLTAKAMAWFWDAYAPDIERRLEPYASPLRATDEQLVAVTTVRYDGITHHFMMHNPERRRRSLRSSATRTRCGGCDAGP